MAQKKKQKQKAHDRLQPELSQEEITIIEGRDCATDVPDGEAHVQQGLYTHTLKEMQTLESGESECGDSTDEDERQNEEEGENVEEEMIGSSRSQSPPSTASDDSSSESPYPQADRVLHGIKKRIEKRDTKILKYRGRNSKLLDSLKKRHSLLLEADEVASDLAKSRQDRLFGNTVYSLHFPELVTMIKDEASMWYESKVIGRLVSLADLDVRAHSAIQDIGKVVAVNFREECKAITSMSWRQAKSQIMEDKLSELANLQSKRCSLIQKLITLEDQRLEELLERRMKCARSVRAAFLKQSPQVVKGRFGLRDVGMGIVAQLDKRIQSWEERLEQLTKSEKSDSRSSKSSDA